MYINKIITLNNYYLFQIPSYINSFLFIKYLLLLTYNYLSWRWGERKDSYPGSHRGGTYSTV